MKGRNHKIVPGETEVHVTTFGDRVRRAVKAFKGEKADSLEVKLGVDIKRCDECEYKDRWQRDEK